MTCKIKPQTTLLQPLFVPQKLLMGPGPCNCSTKIMNASSQQMLGHLDEDFLKIMNDVKMGIKYAFQTSNEMTFALSGSGHCAMETAICNAVEPEDNFLIASSGIWGDRALDMGQRIGANCHQLKIPAGNVLHLDQLTQAMLQFKPRVIFICHGDSSTGVLQPLEEITSFLAKFNVVIIVECVASLAAVPLYMDEWGIDILYSGSQKVLSAPPGASPISFSSKAVQKIKSRKSPVTSFYMDALLIGNYWRCDEGPLVYHHTAPISLIYALREALAILAEETLEKCWQRHKLCALKLHTNLQDMGLTLFVPNKIYRLPSVTAVNIPTYVKGPKVIECMRKRFNIDIGSGLGLTLGKVWRIGLMGGNCSEANVSLVSNALQQCINDSSLSSSL